MPSIEDQTMKCAQDILAAVTYKPSLSAVHGAPELPSKVRIAAIIATFAEPILKLLAESRRSHSGGYNDEGCDYPPCPRRYEDEGELTPDILCTCGADTWNKRVDDAIR